MSNVFVSQKRMSVLHRIFGESNKQHLYSASSCMIWRSKHGWFDGIGGEERAQYVTTSAQRAQEWATKKERAHYATTGTRSPTLNAGDEI